MKNEHNNEIQAYIQILGPNESELQVGKGGKNSGHCLLAFPSSKDCRILTLALLMFFNFIFIINSFHFTF